MIYNKSQLRRPEIAFYFFHISLILDGGQNGRIGAWLSYSVFLKLFYKRCFPKNLGGGWVKCCLGVIFSTI